MSIFMEIALNRIYLISLSLFLSLYLSIYLFLSV